MVTDIVHTTTNPCLCHGSANVAFYFVESDICRSSKLQFNKRSQTIIEQEP